MKCLLTICAVTVLVLAVSTTANAVTWNVGLAGDFTTIQDAIDSPLVMDGHTLLVSPGNHAGAEVDKSVEIRGEGGAVINDGPELRTTGLFQGFRMLAGSDGATITHLDFTTVDFPVMNGEGVDEVTVDHCTLSSPIQGISNWNGQGWSITHNVINSLRTRNGGGIGIFVGTYTLLSTANDTLIAHNKITGQVIAPCGEHGGYSTPGIALMSDGRQDPAGPLSGNRIIKNKISLELVLPDPTTCSIIPSEMVCVGIELTDYALYTSTSPDLTGNKVGFNDVRGVIGIPIALNPDDTVANENAISRNLGDDANNRGHGLHPKAILK
ncbi:MAG: right-handed parallel beta-helix repeat-containing protein [Planctomycetota bacterium]|jgi:hypothetical protein